MAGQTGFHCIACHQFTAEVPLLATRDSAAGTLRPGAHECFSCHEMRAKLADFDPSRDPHRQTCGMCHNPHEQTRPADALKSCASAGCHADWRDEPFHVGAPHRRIAQQCELCHHQAPAASKCATCHAPGELSPVHAETMTVAVDTRPARSRVVAFAHTTHARLPCTTCHETPVSLAPAAPVKSCTACHEDHHTARRDCAGCHAGGEIRAAHADSVNAHVGCDACHREATVARLEPDRGLCLTCHNAQREHYATKECTTCHFLASPADYRAHLRKAGA